MNLKPVNIEMKNGIFLSIKVVIWKLLQNPPETKDEKLWGIIDT